MRNLIKRLLDLLFPVITETEIRADEEWDREREKLNLSFDMRW